MFVRLKVWGVIRNADVLVVRAYDWVTHEVRYLINGEEYKVTLTPEQADELAEAVKAAHAK